MTNRREIREIVLQALYALHQSGDSLQHVADTILKEHIEQKDENRRFAEKLFFRTVENQEELNSVITGELKNWDYHRLALIDRLILRMALCEFLYFEEIPTKVTMNEAIEIAKKYSTAKSGKFINGILDASLHTLKDAEMIQKKGRGLIESSFKGKNPE